MTFNAQTIGAATTVQLASFTYSDDFSISFAEVDMMAINLVEGRLYEIDIDNGFGGDLYLKIFDQFGAEVRAIDDGSLEIENVIFPLSPYLRFTPNFTGLYYFAVSPWYLTAYDPFATQGRSAGENPLFSTTGTLIINDYGTSSWGTGIGSINGIVAESGGDFTDMVSDTDRSNRVEVSGVMDSLTDVDIVRFDLVKADRLVIDVNGALDGSTVGTVLRAFNDQGVGLGFDDDSGFGEDPEFILNVPFTGDFYIGISGEGNSTYNALDGSGTVAATATGGYEVIIHRNPTLVGSGLTNLFTGSAGDDYIVTLGANDTASGGEGADTLAGGDDQDSLIGDAGADQLYGEAGNDILNGGSGNDVLSGGLGNDTLNGGLNADALDGGTGNDSLNGGQKNFADTLRGGTGLDTLVGDAGNDLLFGDDGDDSLDGGNGADSAEGGTGNDVLSGGTGNDTLSGGSNDDLMLGGDSDDLIMGDLGNDTLRGEAHRDNLLGGGGSDSLAGGTGTDTLDGGEGSDILLGGGGADVFRFATVADGVDLVSDMLLGSDRIDLSPIFLASGAVVTAANLSQFVQITPSGAGADSFLAIDANGLTGGLSFTIIAQVNGVTPLQLFDAANFIL